MTPEKKAPEAAPPSHGATEVLRGKAAVPLHRASALRAILAQYAPLHGTEAFPKQDLRLRDSVAPWRFFRRFFRIREIRGGN